MLKVAYIVYSFHTGGLERCVARLAIHLDRSRFQPIIICLNQSGNAKSWLNGIDVPIYELNKCPGNDPGLVIRFAHLLRKEKVDLVHSHNWGSLLETVFARLLGSVPFHVHAERGLELAEIEAGRWRRSARALVSRTALASVDAVVAVSQEIRDKLVSSGMSVRCVHLIPNGIDPLPVAAPDCERARIRRELELDEPTVLACSVSRLSPVKDLATAIKSIALLARGGRDVHLALVGEGPECDALGALARSLGVAGRVHLVGEQKDVGAWLAAADIYVNSSLYEGMSQAILEAMAAGLPLVVTDVGENATMVGDASPCGRVVPAGNVHAFASALAELSADEELRAGLGRRARQRQRDDFSQERMVRRYENLYERLAPARASLLGRRVPWRRR